MRYLILFALYLTYCTAIISQNKQDYYWPHAQDWDADKPGVQGFELDFNNRPFGPSIRDSELSMGQNNASICDKDGNLLFYTNGCAVANAQHQIMPHGDSINAGPHFFDFWGGDCRRGYPGSQNVLILQDPSNVDGYYLLHMPFTYSPHLEPEFMFSNDSIQYSYVDMEKDNGNGDVIEKNRNFYEGPVLSSYFTAIHHTNGNDWWIVNAAYPSGFIVFNLTEEGFEIKNRISGPVYDIYSSASGPINFSPDGQTFAFYNEYDGLYLYDFDRSDGSFSNERYLHIETSENPWFASCEWSPNSRYLYVTKTDTLWQLDTTVEPLEDGLVFIAEKAQIQNGDPTNPGFDIATLGPDCRIYIRGKSGSLTFHVIHKPDEAGLACDFQQQGIQLPVYSAAGSFPNFPRFRVDDEEKCDPSIVSILGETVWWRRDLTVYPIPTSGPVTVELPEDHHDGKVYVVDMQGQVVLDKDVRVLVGELQLDLGGLPVGSYSVEYVPRDGKERTVWTRRVMVVE